MSGSWSCTLLIIIAADEENVITVVPVLFWEVM
jgi:hypothetical protein